MCFPPDENPTGLDEPLSSTQNVEKEQQPQLCGHHDQARRFSMKFPPFDEQTRELTQTVTREG